MSCSVACFLVRSHTGETWEAPPPRPGRLGGVLFTLRSDLAWEAWRGLEALGGLGGLGSLPPGLGCLGEFRLLLVQIWLGRTGGAWEPPESREAWEAWGALWEARGSFVQFRSDLAWEG